MKMAAEKVLGTFRREGEKKEERGGKGGEGEGRGMGGERRKGRRLEGGEWEGGRGG